MNFWETEANDTKKLKVQDTLRIPGRWVFSDLKTFPANQLLSCTTGARAITSQTVGTILTQDFQREVCEVSLTA